MAWHMIVLAYHNYLGVAQVYTLPADNMAKPAMATLPEGPFGYAVSAIAAKGPAVAWMDYAYLLTRQAPYFGWWSVEDVPEPSSIQEALGYVREHDGLLARASRYL